MRHRSRFLVLLLTAFLLFSSLGRPVAGQLAHRFSQDSRASQYGRVATLASAQKKPQPAPQPQSLIQKGLASYHSADYASAIQFWRQALAMQAIAPDTQAQLHQYLGRAYQATGQTQAAIDTFDWLLNYYRQARDRQISSQTSPQTVSPQTASPQDSSLEVTRTLGHMLTEQAQNYGRMGHHPRASSMLCRYLPPIAVEKRLEQAMPLSEQPLDCNPDSAVSLALEARDQAGLVAALGSLAQSQRLQGEYELAIATVQRGLWHLAHPGDGVADPASSASSSLSSATSSAVPEVADSVQLASYRRALQDNLGNLYAAQAARNLRLAEFAQSKGKRRQAIESLRAVRRSNQLALDSFALVVEGEPDRRGTGGTDDQADKIAQNDTNVLLELSQSRLNAMAVARRDGTEPSPQQWKQIRQQVRSLPPSRGKVYALLKLVSLSQPLAKQEEQDPRQLGQSSVQGAVQGTVQGTGQRAATVAPAAELLDSPVFKKSGLQLSAFRSEAPTYCAPPGRKTLALLREARRVAQRLQDQRAEAFVLGRLGHFYECQGAFPRALEWTRRARLLAPNRDNRYRWDWQEGRILRAQGDWEGALAAYENTLETLRDIRGELAVAARDFQLDFREAIEPIYRGVTELRLRAAEEAIRSARASTKALSGNGLPGNDSSTGSRASSGDTLAADSLGDQLGRVLQGLDELHLFELQNYLGHACDLPEPKPLTAANRSTAFLSTMVLDDRVAVILTLPTATSVDQPSTLTQRAVRGFKLRSQLSWIERDRQSFNADINAFRLALGKRSDRTLGYRTLSMRFYNELIRPFHEDLEAAGIKTLVFMHDGLLRSVPMAALYDQERGRFLVEDYALAATPSISLVDPKPWRGSRLQVRAFGLTQAAQVEVAQAPLYFPALENVALELKALTKLMPASQGLLDEDFTLRSIRHSLRSIQAPSHVLHLATHARFGFDGRQTFLVMGPVDDGVSPALRDNRLWAPRQTKRSPRSSTSALPAASKGRRSNGKLTLLRLQELANQVSEPLELLTLSACETATGSERDILGIAGMAFQSGIWSTLASLWQVDDATTAEMMVQFYGYLQNLDMQNEQPQLLGRAMALQAMQKQWLADHRGSPYRHPGYWAPFVLVGNWM